MGQLDTLIELYKSQLPSDSARKLYDYLMLGSLRNKDATERLGRALKAEKNQKSKFYMMLKDAIY